MNTEERKNTILEMLKKSGTVKVSTLAELFRTSEVTIRNYLSDMEEKGLLSRVHGGAISSYRPYYSMNLGQRLETNQAEKQLIANKISEMISPNDTIMLNAGTTTLLVFRSLPSDYNLNIVTNSISIALEASHNPNYNVVLVGGAVNTKYQFTYGNDAIHQLQNYYADKLILSVDGIDTKSGLTTYYNNEAPIDEAMISRSSCCIVAADFSKFCRSAFTKISDLKVADYIVTNTEISKEVIDSFGKLSAEIILA